MAVKIRLARHGSKKRPYYRVVVADSRSPRDGRLIEEVGRYNPLTNPKTIDLDIEKINDWQSKGAQLTDAVEQHMEPRLPIIGSGEDLNAALDAFKGSDALMVVDEGKPLGVLTRHDLLGVHV